MEICHIILGKANPDRMNGVNRVVNELVSRQTLAGLQVNVWGIASDLLHNYPIRIFPTKLFRKKYFPFSIPSELENEIRKKAGEQIIFHLHGGFIPQFYTICKLLHKYNIPFVITPHGSYNVIAMNRNNLVKKFYFHYFESTLLKNAMAIHSLGQSEIEGLKKIYPNDKTVLIPYGIDLTPMPGNITPSPGFIIGYCGRMDLYTKGLKELVIGFDMFFSKHPHADLWIIGDGPEREILEKLAHSLTAANRIKFWGAQYGNQKEDILSQCSVFASPSRNEGLPSAILEAAAMGIPCLVTEATNMGDYIRKYKAGKVIAHTEPEEIFNGLNSLYHEMKSPVDKAQYKFNTRKMIENEFSWSNVLSQFNAMYECRTIPMTC
ncbi:glycosyltransferase family 4 protein [Chitinophaga sancti]|uniref:Glycosyltransferase n=1 Tax=Chitinophaga sancti TaxID=1004 RepID=A0A1K1RUQ9_9BACT|nr:glycosyltransferase [Chitinophaga sancti]WQD62348.1 glycosyltransferase [Chitinophaga sancti]WQG92083.1 glycosyltransferase [Chitinophaga sancti]SFW75793.1 Glycosyltransferase involved in cell wall bisynthesis [Chitinophaga sancti]